MENLNQSEIPKLIHFVWAGGNSPMKLQDLQVVAAWAIKNPDFKIKIWVDPKTFDGGMGKLEEYYFSQLKIAYEKEKQLSVSIEEIKHMFSLNDIRKEGICQENDKIFDHEVDRLDPNFGASSDYIRYKILYKEGGVYIDSDVRPGEDNLSKLPIFNQPISHCLYVDHLSQRATIKNENLYKIFTIEPHPQYGTWGVGNDTFICTKQNPLMFEVIKELEDNYNLTSNPTENINKILEMAYYGHNIEQITLGKTGPTLLREAISKKPSPIQKDSFTFVKKCTDTLVEIKPVRCELYKLTQPLPHNTGHWLNASPDISQIHNITDIYKKLFKLIDEEIKYYGILRLDDHVRLVKLWARKLDMNPNIAVKTFIEGLQDTIELEKISVVQNCSTNKYVLEFCNNNNLIDKTYLTQQSSSCFGAIYQWATCYPRFTSSLFSKKILFDNKEFITEPQKNIVQYLSAGKLNLIFNELECGIDFMEKVHSNTCALKYPFIGLKIGDNDMLEMHNIYVINIYRTLELFESSFIKAGVDPERIKAAKEQLTQACHNDLPGLFKCPINEILKKYYNKEKDGDFLPLIGVALRRACFYGDYDSAESLIYCSSNLNDQDPTLMRTALHVACGKNYIKIAELLINAKVNVNLQDKDGKTPLHWAVENKNIELIKLLMEAGADIKIKNSNGKTPLQLASSQSDIIEALKTPSKKFYL